MPSLVGRESELGAVETFLRSERPCALAIVGEPGIGKTTLWQVAVEHARAQGARVLLARPTESEAKLAFAGLADLLADVPDELFARLPEPQRVGLDAALLRAASARPPERRVVGAGFLTLLRALAGESEVVCAIDDLHWLDASSAAVVEFALRRLGEEPVRGLVSVRATELARAPIPALERDLQFEHIELGPLSVAALHRVLTQELGRTFPRPTLVRIAQAAGGNPLYAVEIARELNRRGEHDVSAAFPSHRASTRSSERASEPFRPRRATRCCAPRPWRGRTRRPIDPVDLEPAEEAGLVRIEVDGRIHSSTRSSRRRCTPPPGGPAPRAHRAVADLARDPEERARHLALAASGPDAGVVRELQAAARHARMRGSPDSAAELTGLALRLLPASASARPELQLELAEQLHLASDFPAARALLEELRTTLQPGDLRARALLALVEIDYWGRGESAATALAEEALADARDPVLKARCHVVVAGYAGTVDLPKAATSAREALALLEGVAEPDPGLVAAALGARVRADLFLGDGFDRETAMRALALEESNPPATVDTRVLFKLGQWLRYIDDLDGARAAPRARGAAGARGGRRIVARQHPAQSRDRRDLGRRPGRGGGAGRAHARRLRPATGSVRRPEHLWRAYVDAYAGRVVSVREAAAKADPGEPMVAAIWSRCVGLAELAAGETVSADRHLTEALEVFERVAFREPAIWRIDGDAIEAALAVGDVDRAQVLLARFEERAARSRIPWSLAVSARCRGLVLAARGELDAAAEALERALAEHERCPMPFERARTLLVQGRLQRRLKQKRQARLSLEEARELFARQGAETWAARVDESWAESQSGARRRS